MKFEKKICLLIVILSVFMIPFSAFAHPGRTDANGGHYDRKTGKYHYHNGGSSRSTSSTRSKSSSKGSTGISKKTTAPSRVYASKINAVNVPKQINIGEEIQLEGSVYPANSEDKDIVWESDNPKIAEVSEKGVLRALNIGAVKIKAKTSRGTTSEFNIEIKEVQAESININEKPSEIFVGENIALSIGFQPENTTDKSVVWKSENEDIAFVSAEGVVSGVNAGTTLISAIHRDCTDTFEISVKPVEPESIIIKCQDNKNSEEGKSNQDDNNKSTVRLLKGETLQLTALITPDNATDKKIKWSEDNDNIAEIDENGLLTGHNVGKVLITAASSNGVMDTIEIEIYSDISSAIFGFIFIAGIAALIIVFVKRKKKTS